MTDQSKLPDEQYNELLQLFECRHWEREPQPYIEKADLEHWLAPIVEAEVQRRIADAKKDSDRLQYILRFVWFHAIGGRSYYITLNEENDLPLPNASTDLLSRVDAALIGKPPGDSHDNG